MSLYGCCGWRFLGPGWHLDSNSLSPTIDTVCVISRDDCLVKYPKTLCYENQCLKNIPASGPQACLAHNYSNPVFVSTDYSQCFAMSTNERQTNKILVNVVKNLPWLRSTALPPLQWLTGGTFDWRRRRRRCRSWRRRKMRKSRKMQNKWGRMMVRCFNCFKAFFPFWYFVSFSNGLVWLPPPASQSSASSVECFQQR